ncbi:dermonecrotic toxin domain-containing protein [Luteibacter yeojuensis]|uniref:Dermonecrotic toxin N-terminal domain-containing protein n=1 Tax=Luteibacter yeojuensis TaxID=345309 RepID=A0A0F3KWK1_9GAMM|nr:DUF6543 domain-containing protein [Luteibacter yeojuensis]KJV35347.1 hypothetical protein VI08_08665 [Luteibacter yeojuensis]
MDALPPPPPAVVRAVDQDAVDAATRLIDMERWLHAQQASLPTPPLQPDNASLAAFAGDVDAWWASRREPFKARLAAAMGDIALLRGFDGSLPDDTCAAAIGIATVHGMVLPHVALHEVTVGGAPYAGAFLAADTRPAGKVISFLPARGWDTHDTAAAALQAIEAHARRALASRTDLPGVAHTRLGGAGEGPIVASRPLQGRLFDTLVDGIIRAQREKMDAAWAEFSLGPGVPGRHQHLADALRDALRLADAFDVASILEVRDARLRMALADERLATVPADVAAQWRQARRDYAEGMQAIAAREGEAGIAPPGGLHDYTMRQLRTVLTGLGIDDDPADITITLHRGTDVAAWFESFTSLFTGPEPLHAPLLDLALRNVPPAGGGLFTASGKRGDAIAPLNDKVIRGMLNRLDVHTRFQALLRRELQEGPLAPLRRSLFATGWAARARHEATDALVATLRDEHAGAAHLGLGRQGLAWVVAALDATAGARTLPNGAAIEVSAVGYLDTTIRDIVEFRATGQARFVLYTPGAPDGVAFRQFAGRDEAERLFYRQPAFREYLLDRLPAAFSELAGVGGARQFKASRGVQWVFGGNLPPGYTQTAGPFEPRPIAGDIAGALYDTHVEHSLRQVREVSRSTADAGWGYLVDLWHRNPAQALPAHAVVATVTAPFRVAPAGWRAYDAVRAGDFGRAFVDATEAYVAAIAAHAAGATALASGTALATLGFRTARGATVDRVLRRGDQPMPSRYPASGPAPAGVPDAHGLYRIDGQQYAAVGGQLYKAYYDAPRRAVRLGSVPAGGDVAGPTIRLQQGLWRLGRQAPPRARYGSNASDDFRSEYVAQLAHAFPDAAERDLVVAAMFREVRGLPAAAAAGVSEAQRSAFRDAMVRAEQAVHTLAGTGPALPGHLRRVSSADLPQRLWFHGDRRIHADAFAHAATASGGEWAAMGTAYQARDVVGIRLTAVPPGAPSSPHDFAVELAVRDIVAARMSGAGPVDLVTALGSSGPDFILRTPPGQPLVLAPGEFRVVETPM